MKPGRPKLFRVVEYGKTKWLLYRWDTKDKAYHLVDTYRRQETANEEMERRYESRKLNQKFANRIKNFNERSKNTDGVVKL